MDPLVRHLVQANSRHHFWNQNDLLLLAISGGVDSMALLAAMSSLPESERPGLRVLHVNHHLRPEAEEEAALVARVCGQAGIPLVLRDWAGDEQPLTGLEAAARAARYHFFQEEMAASQAQSVVTAHHGDDQMETILMRLTRGSTAEGTAGIKPFRRFGSGRLIRPFLDVEKETLYAYCRRNGVEYREDASNTDPAFTRNRYRRQVVPFLKKENAQAVQHFQEFSEDLLALWEVAAPRIELLFAECFTFEKGKWLLDIPHIQTFAWGTQRLIVGHFLQNAWIAPKGTFQRSHVQDILNLLESPQPQATLHLPRDRKAQKRYRQIWFLTGEASFLRTEEETISPYPLKLGLNQWLQLPFNGKIGLFSYKIGKCLLQELEQSEAIRLGDETKLPLVIRHPEPGDRIRLNPAAPFTKKVARLFIDRKLSNEVRREALILEDGGGEILWIPGHALSLHGRTAPKEIDREEPDTGYLVIYNKDDEVKA